MPLDMVEITAVATPSVAGGGDDVVAAKKATAAASTRAIQLHMASAASSAPSSPLGPRCASPLHTTVPTSHSANRLDSRPACCNDRLYGPHTSTIRMNPYVRCVRDSGVPEIRSLKELLSLKNQPAPAEPDTPCLRPAHGPASIWQGSPTSAFLHERVMESTSGAAAAAAGAREQGQALSPMLAFTADSVATPNTFATVVTHEQRIMSHLTRRLRNSVRRHQDMPCGEPMEMLLSAGDEDDEEEEAVTEEEGGTAAPAQGRDASAAEKERAEVCEVPMLPCSTRDKAAEAEAAAAAAATSTPETCVVVHSSSSTLTLSETTTVAQVERSPACPCTPCSVEQEQEQQRWLLQVNNERIVSPHSSSGMLCEFPGAQRVAMKTRQRRPSQHAHSVSHPHSHPPHGHDSHAAAVLRSYPAPVAKLEESPYHYIMRNYIGGTFLYYSSAESKDYFLRLCHRVVAQVRPLLEQETLSPHHGLFPRINAPAYVFGDIHGNFEDLSFFLKRLLIFHDFNLTPANILCLGDYVDRGPFSLECVMLLFSLKIMNSSKIVMLRGNHEDRVVCGDLQTYGRGCFLGQCQTVFGYSEGMKLFKEVTALFKYLPLAAELVIPSTPNIAFLRSQQTVMHPNLYVSQPAVLLHDAASAEAPLTAAQTGQDEVSSPSSPAPPVARHPHPGGEVASGESSDDLLSKSTTGSSSPAIAVAAATTTTAGYNTIADSSLARGQPSRHEAHEERILCTHGGIPRFDRPPLEENALNSLRSLAFPRMLTLFPNNPMVKDDPECAPNYFARSELPELWRRYPSTAPSEFTAALRRETAEAAAAAASALSPQNPLGLLSMCSVQTGRSASSARSASCHSLSGSDDGGRDRSGSTSSAASCSVSSLNATSSAYRPQFQCRRSSDFLPLPNEEQVRKAWYTMCDLLWSDPMPMELEEENAGLLCSGAAAGGAAAAAAARMHINEWGFGINTRGSNVVSFSARAVDTFLTAHHYSMLFRAHQEKAHGLRWSKSNKVLTIFSSSNYMGHGNGAGCVVVAANGEVQMVEKVCM